MTAAPDETIAGLRTEIAALRATLAERDDDRAERIAHQVATVDVLKAMSASPGDPRPVFDLIAVRSRDICGAYGVTVFEFDGALIHRHAETGVSEDVAEREAARADYPMPPTCDRLAGRAIIERGIVRIPDHRTEPGLLWLPHYNTAKSSVTVPMMRGGVPIGALSMGSRELGGFSDTQTELLQTFAEQAVIAITSAETYRALHARTAELAERNTAFAERIEHQAATIDVLKEMSASPGDAQPVFELICRQARNLLPDVANVTLFEFDGELVHLRTIAGGEPQDPTAVNTYRLGWPRVPDRGSLSCRAIMDGAMIHIRDLALEPGIADVVRNLGHRTQLSIPLMRDGRAVGAISTGTMQVDGITDTQIALMQTFAEQAVIAIASAEAHRSQREALEQQTATAEVLGVINASPGDLAPVFDALLEKALRLCGGTIGGIFTIEDNRSVTRALRGVTPAFAAFQEQYPIDEIQPGTVPARIIDTRRPVQNPDTKAGESYRSGFPFVRAMVDLGNIRAVLAVPLLKDGAAIGMIAIYRDEPGAFTDKQIALLENFAAQAVIAMENARLLTEQREALERQTALAEVMDIINRSHGGTSPVFDAIVERSLRLLDAVMGCVGVFEGDTYRLVSSRNLPDALVAAYEAPVPLSSQPATSATARLLAGENVVHLRDAMDDDLYRAGDPARRLLVDVGGARGAVWVALRRGTALLGMLIIYWRRPHDVAENQLALIQAFAAQAVVAIENARLLSEQQEALVRQTATAEVLAIINANPGNLPPVFDAMLEKAMRLCGVAFGRLIGRDGDMVVGLAARGLPPTLAEWDAENRSRPVGPGAQLIYQTKRPFQMLDIRETDGYRSGNASIRAVADLGNGRTNLMVPLVKDESVLGYFHVFRQEVRAFGDKEVALLESFAAQAVIAMENARLLNEVRQRQEELRITFENMTDGVAMFDETQHLVAWNRKFQVILDVPDDIIAQRQTFAEYIRYLANRGEYGPQTDADEQVRRLTEQSAQPRAYERTRPDGRVIEIHHNPVPSGGFVLIYSDITERKRSEAAIAAARDAAEQSARTIEAAYRDLKIAQANLIQAEKMASLGQLTAGIAHEIKNPLNFVNNFCDLSVELLEELHEAIGPALAGLGEGVREDVEDITATLTSNLKKITEHGRRADGIVRSMLEHSRGSSGERRVVDLNAEVEEALNLAYHGARAQNQSFNISLERDYADAIAPIELTPQDITRVFLNLINNGFYAATKRAQAEQGFAPVLKVSTRDLGDRVEIRVRDNGTGVPLEIRGKLFQPFFTTKPTGEGTGLGLSISYDIVTKQHGGSIAVDSEPGAFTEFTVTLPRNAAGAAP